MASTPVTAIAAVRTPPMTQQHSATKASAVTYGKSWADDIQKYHAAKATLPWMPEQQTPVKHVTRFEKSREEREYDLVVGKFRDPERELSHTRQETQALESNLENARAKQLRNVQRFNVVNHAPMFPDAKDPKDKPPQAHPYRKKIAPEYNIISNVPISGSNNSRTGIGKTPTSPALSKRPTREFNILTNKYHENHDVRSQLDDVKKKEIAAIKYNKTRTFDPVRITFVDEERERAFVLERECEQQIHGKDRILLLPPREQFAEGRLYNILNQRVINAEKLAAASERDQRALNKMRKSEFEAEMRVLGDEMLARETALCLNRYAHERNAQAYIHGYDPISNEAFDGRHAKPMMPTRTHAALSAWQVLDSGVPVHTKIKSPLHAKPSTATPTDLASSLRPVKSTPQTSGALVAAEERHARETQRTNILVVGNSQRAPQATISVRTGGFSQ